MNKENFQTDPSIYNYLFNFDNFSCFALQSGKCTFNLTDAEYQEFKRLSPAYSLANVGHVEHCRQLKKVLEDKAIELSDYDGIEMSTYACGHTTFIDGQHRSCIAYFHKFDKLLIKKETFIDRSCISCKGTQIRYSPESLHKIDGT